MAVAVEVSTCRRMYAFVHTDMGCFDMLGGDVR